MYSKWKLNANRAYEHPKNISYLTQISHKIIYERMLLTVYRANIKSKSGKPIHHLEAQICDAKGISDTLKMTKSMCSSFSDNFVLRYGIGVHEK